MLCRLIHVCVGLYEFKAVQHYVKSASELMRLLCTRLDDVGARGPGEVELEVDEETERDPFFAPFFIERALCHYHQSEFEAAYANAFRALSLLRSLYRPRHANVNVNSNVNANVNANADSTTSTTMRVRGGRRTVFELTERHPLQYLAPTAVLDVVRHASKICVVRRQFKDAALLVEYAIRYARYCPQLHSHVH